MEKHISIPGKQERWKMFFVSMLATTSSSSFRIKLLVAAWIPIALHPLTSKSTHACRTVENKREETFESGLLGRKRQTIPYFATKKKKKKKKKEPFHRGKNMNCSSGNCGIWSARTLYNSGQHCRCRAGRRWTNKKENCDNVSTVGSHRCGLWHWLVKLSSSMAIIISVLHILKPGCVFTPRWKVPAVVVSGTSAPATRFSSGIWCGSSRSSAMCSMWSIPPSNMEGISLWWLLRASLASNSSIVWTTMLPYSSCPASSGMMSLFSWSSWG